MSMSDEFYDDWRATEDTHDYYCPIEAEAEAKLQEIENEIHNG